MAGLYAITRPGALIDNADTLRAGPGSSGVVVGEIQGLLNTWGASPPLAIDDDYGPLTTAAVRAFQTANNLDADGIVGPITSRALQDTDSKSVGSFVSPVTGATSSKTGKTIGFVVAAVAAGGTAYAKRKAIAALFAGKKGK